MKSGAPDASQNPKIKELINKIGKDILDSPNLDAACEKTVSLLKESNPRYTWVGIYLLRGNTLTLKTYLGRPTPHREIPIDKGICGAAVRENQTIIAPDVKSDPRYLACSIETQSEIVVPIRKDGKVTGEVDIDSDYPDAFGDEDRILLENVADLLGNKQLK